MKIERIEATWVSIPIAQERQHRSDFGQIRTFDAAILRIETDDVLVVARHALVRVYDDETPGYVRPSDIRMSRRFI